MASVALADDHGRAPQQSRSRETQARIVRAAESLFAERGYDGTTVQDITMRARCSVGSFYARFKDKESLFLHIHDQHCAELLQRMEFLCDLFEAENSRLDIVVHQIVRALFVFAGKRRTLTRVFMQRSADDPAFQARYATVWKQVQDLLQAALLRRRGEIKVPNPERAVAFTLQCLHGLWANDVLHYPTHDITGQISGEALAAEATEACLAWLGVAGKR
jgi:AcrR family transcriptional regulator